MNQDEAGRLFALVEMLANPETAKKNADEIRKLQAKITEDGKQLKAIKAERYALQKDLKDIEAGHAAVAKENKLLDQRKQELDDKEQDLVSKIKVTEELIKKKLNELNKEEHAFSKRMEAAEVRLKSINGQIGAAGKRKLDIEKQIESLKKAIGNV